jgi:hypothetical protein
VEIDLVPDFQVTVLVPVVQVFAESREMADEENPESNVMGNVTDPMAESMGFNPRAIVHWSSE